MQLYDPYMGRRCTLSFTQGLWAARVRATVCKSLRAPPLTSIAHGMRGYLYGHLRQSVTWPAFLVGLSARSSPITLTLSHVRGSFAGVDAEDQARQSHFERRPGLLCRC